MRTVKAADLFCGAGGTSTGLARAASALGVRLSLVAVNHWERAIETHALNHPWAEHVCHGLDEVSPRRVCPDGLDVLVASPECTHHSRAAGGRPKQDQSRATAWHVVRWAEELRPREILVENVAEFREWGPLDDDGKPVAAMRGRTFRDWCRCLRGLGYRLEVQELMAADYGDATTRRRLFVRATRTRRVVWPRQTHAEEPGLFGLLPWRPAREVIDWSLPTVAIHERSRPLAEATLARIEAGIRRYWGEWAEPFLVTLRRNVGPRPLSAPTPSITAGGTHLGLVEPLVMGQQGGAIARPVSRPMPTVTTGGVVRLVEPLVVAWDNQSGNGVWRTGQPLSTITTKARHGVLEPLLVPYYGTSTVSPVSLPVPTVTTRDRFGLLEARGLAVGFRMLQPAELAGATGFPAEYRFAGSKAEVVRQIGNAVPVNMAEALASGMLEAMS